MEHRSVNRFPVKDPAEVVVLSFDFSAELGAETISGSPTIAIATYAGIDATPGTVLYGSPAITGQAVIQTVRQGLDGVDYKIKTQINTSGGRTLVLSGVLPVLVL
jgi:hypothetical protein